jgi:hypothetical protein
VRCALYRTGTGTESTRGGVQRRAGMPGKHLWQVTAC